MKQRCYRLVVLLANAIEPWLVRRPALYKVLLAPPLSGVRRRLGVWRAWVNAERAYRRVPAYRAFVDGLGGPPPLRLVGGLPDLSAWPEIDKTTYVQRFDQPSRCVDGLVPVSGVSIDESSGSSGRPTSWIRGPQEREITKAMMQLSFRTAVGDAPMFVINAFSLGAWATGLNVTQSLSDITRMKSTGPDIDKIVSTLHEFGPEYDYVITGYPPFLKTLADDDRIDWTAYRVRAIFGGEGMSEAMREYMLRSFTQVVGSYGASDLEINMAAESPFTIALRRQMLHDATLRARLTDTTIPTLPMVLQYNPLAYTFETNRTGELVVTLSRPANIAPKIRYNIHDLGHVATFTDVARIVQELGCAHLLDDTDAVHLPLLFLYGRSDQSVDYYGANVTPDSVRDVLFGIDELVPHLSSYQLLSSEDERHDTTLQVAVELKAGSDPSQIDDAAVAERLFNRLADVNADFRNAYRHTATKDRRPRLTLHRSGCGPFTQRNGIKNQYVAARS